MFAFLSAATADGSMVVSQQHLTCRPLLPQSENTRIRRKKKSRVPTRPLYNTTKQSRQTTRQAKNNARIFSRFFSLVLLSRSLQNLISIAPKVAKLKWKKRRNFVARFCSHVGFGFSLGFEIRQGFRQGFDKVFGKVFDTVFGKASIQIQK